MSVIIVSMYHYSVTPSGLCLSCFFLPHMLLYTADSYSCSYFPLVKGSINGWIILFLVWSCFCLSSVCVLVCFVLVFCWWLVGDGCLVGCLLLCWLVVVAVLRCNAGTHFSLCAMLTVLLILGSEKKNNNSETPPQEKKLQAVLGLATFTEKLVLLMLYKAKAHNTCICNITW